MNKRDKKNLKKRYLLWLYKTTKEALDKIERRFTQLEVDKFMFKEFEKFNKDTRLKKFLDELKAYVRTKEKDSYALKYEEKGLKPDYKFLILKLKVIEKAIFRELGSKALKEIKSLYEKEMIERILRSVEHK